jgi:4-hydroxy-tetrahydrodipicolinate reductase
MTKIIISGAEGQMGHAVARAVGADPDSNIVAGFDLRTDLTGPFPVYGNCGDFTGESDVVVDFSSPAALSTLIAFCESRKIPLVLCATGYSSEQLREIDSASERLPVFRTGNLSIGVNLLLDLISRAASVLGEEFDVEIIEKHHRRKVDAPSGTALMLADAAKSALPYEPDYIYERQSRREPRRPHEIGISAVRGGTIVGEHEVIFAGQDEVIELKHTATSRDVFATGALRAAKFMAGVKAPGLYNMGDVLAK